MNSPLVYIIHPVTNVTPEKRARALELATLLEEVGAQVYLPGRDTDQGQAPADIVKANLGAILGASMIFVIFDEHSKGGFFDLGAAMLTRTPIYGIASDRKWDGQDFYRQLVNHMFASMDELKATLKDENSEIRQRLQRYMSDNSNLSVFDYYEFMDRLSLLIDRVDDDLLCHQVCVYHSSLAQLLNFQLQLMEISYQRAGHLFSEAYRRMKDERSKG